MAKYEMLYLLNNDLTEEAKEALLNNLIPFADLGVNGILAFFMAYSMPVAGLASAFADHYGGDGENAVILTLGSTVLSVATIPVLYWLLTMFIK